MGGITLLLSGIHNVKKLFKEQQSGIVALLNIVSIQT